MNEIGAKVHLSGCVQTKVAIRPERVRNIHQTRQKGTEVRQGGD